MLPNYPETFKLLTAAEKEAIIDALPKTQPSSKSKTWITSEFISIFKDPATLTFLLIWICHSIGGWGISLVLPTVIYDLGFSVSAISQVSQTTVPNHTDRR
jgi:hypothetical protein